MKFEDLFKPRENYYEAFPSNTLDDFFKSRELRLKEETPIDEATTEEIKAKFSPAPPAPVPQAPQAPMPQRDIASETMPQQPEMQTMEQPQEAISRSPEDLIDIKRIRQLAEESMPKKTWKDVLPYLAPLAVEALMGSKNIGAAPAQIMAKGLLQDVADTEKRKLDLENKLIDIQRTRPRAIASKTPDLKEFFREKRFQQAQEQRKSLEDRKIKLATRDKLNQDMDFKKQRARYAATNDAINILNKKSWAGDQGIGFLFAKGIFGEVGSLTNEERTAFIANPAIENKFNFYLEKYLKKGGGTFTEEDRRELIKLADFMRDRAKENISGIASGYVEGTKSLGIDPSGIINPLLKFKDVQSIYDVKKPTFEEWKKAKGL